MCLPDNFTLLLKVCRPKICHSKTTTNTFSTGSGWFFQVANNMPHISKQSHWLNLFVMMLHVGIISLKNVCSNCSYIYTRQSASMSLAHRSQGKTRLLFFLLDQPSIFIPLLFPLFLHPLSKRLLLPSLIRLTNPCTALLPPPLCLFQSKMAFLLQWFPMCHLIWHMNRHFF